MLFFFLFYYPRQTARFTARENRASTMPLKLSRVFHSCSNGRRRRHSLTHRSRALHALPQREVHQQKHGQQAQRQRPLDRPDSLQTVGPVQLQHAPAANKTIKLRVDFGARFKTSFDLKCRRSNTNSDELKKKNASENPLLGARLCRAFPNLRANFRVVVRPSGGVLVLNNRCSGGHSDFFHFSILPRVFKVQTRSPGGSLPNRETDQTQELNFTKLNFKTTFICPAEYVYSISKKSKKKNV